MTAYDWVKALHLTAVAVWMGGMMANALALLALPTGAPPPALSIMRKWDRRVTLPAMLVTWAAGITMAIWAGWWRAGWLWAKLVLVLGLSGLHGVQSASFRRLAAGITPAKWLQLSVLIILGTLPIIATLAAGKPF